MMSKRKYRKLNSRGLRIKRVARKVYLGERFVWQSNLTSQILYAYWVDGGYPIQNGGSK